MQNLQENLIKVGQALQILETIDHNENPTIRAGMNSLYTYEADLLHRVYLDNKRVAAKPFTGEKL